MTGFKINFTEEPSPRVKEALLRNRRNRQTANISHSKRIGRTEFLMEATTFEGHALWNDQLLKPLMLDRHWISDGPSICAGYLDEMPVQFVLRWWLIHSRWVCLFEPTSTVVDYRLIDAWFGLNMPRVADGGKLKLRTDASNFVNILHDCAPVRKDFTVRKFSAISSLVAAAILAFANLGFVRTPSKAQTHLTPVKSQDDKKRLAEEKRKRKAAKVAALTKG